MKCWILNVKGLNNHNKLILVKEWLRFKGTFLPSRITLRSTHFTLEGSREIVVGLHNNLIEDFLDFQVDSQNHYVAIDVEKIIFTFVEIYANSFSHQLELGHYNPSLKL